MAEPPRNVTVLLEVPELVRPLGQDTERICKSANNLDSQSSLLTLEEGHNNEEATELGDVGADRLFTSQRSSRLCLLQCTPKTGERPAAAGEVTRFQLGLASVRGCTMFARAGVCRVTSPFKVRCPASKGSQTYTHLGDRVDGVLNLGAVLLDLCDELVVRLLEAGGGRSDGIGLISLVHHGNLPAVGVEVDALGHDAGGGLAPWLGGEERVLGR